MSKIRDDERLQDIAEIWEQNNNISWSEIARLRDKLIHHYFGINFDIL